MTAMTILEILESPKPVELGPSSWLEVTQNRIDAFADVTDDHQWIHTDAEKASAGPFGATIAHGYLILSLVPRLLAEIFSVADHSMGLNYGIDRLRFISPVPCGSAIRLVSRLTRAEERSRGVRYSMGLEVQIRDHEKPALAAVAVFYAFEDGA